MNLCLRKPSPAMVVACISLFVGLSGVGTAAVVLAKNSVLSKHIRNGQVKTPDLGANAVNSTKVGDGSLLAQDFAAGQLPAGPQGAQGPQGAAGPAGSSVGYVYLNITGTTLTFDAARSKNIVSVQRLGAGHYCVNPNFTAKNAVASGVRDAGSPNAIVETKVFPDGTSCTGDDVQIIVTISGTLVDHNVMAMFN